MCVPEAAVRASILLGKGPYELSLPCYPVHPPHTLSFSFTLHVRVRSSVSRVELRKNMEAECVEGMQSCHYSVSSRGGELSLC